MDEGRRKRKEARKGKKEDREKKPLRVVHFYSCSFFFPDKDILYSTTPLFNSKSVSPQLNQDFYQQNTLYKTSTN